MTERRLKVLESIDWHDGVVLALAELSWAAGEYLATLLAWDPDRRERVLALIPLSDGHGTRIRSCLGCSEWSALVSCLKQVVGEVSGEVPVVRVDEASENVVAELKVDAFDVQRDAISDAEAACGEDRRRWLSLLTTPD